MSKTILFTDIHTVPWSNYFFQFKIRKEAFQRQKKYLGLRKKGPACKNPRNVRGRSGESWGSGSLFFLRTKESQVKSSAQKCNMPMFYLKGRESSQLLNNHKHYNNHCNVMRKNKWLSLRKYQAEDSDFLVFLVNAQSKKTQE